MRARCQLRQTQERVMRAIEPSRVDDQGVTDPQRVEKLLRPEWRRVEPPEIGWDAAEEERVHERREMLTRRTVDVQRDELALCVTRR